MELHFGWEEGKYRVLSPGLSSMDTCLDVASAMCVVCKESVLGETWHQGHLGTNCADSKGAVLFLGVSVQPSGDYHSRARSVPGVAFLPPPSLGNLTRGLFVPVLAQRTHYLVRALTISLSHYHSQMRLSLIWAAEPKADECDAAMALLTCCSAIQAGQEPHQHRGPKTLQTDF